MIACSVHAPLNIFLASCPACVAKIKAYGVEPVNTESILEEAQRLTHGPRGADYGHPLDDYSRTAARINALFAHKLSKPLEPHEAAMIMILVKLSRQVNKPKRDNMTDAAGYAWVVQECLDEESRRAKVALNSFEPTPDISLSEYQRIQALPLLGGNPYCPNCKSDMVAFDADHHYSKACKQCRHRWA